MKTGTGVTRSSDEVIERSDVGGQAALVVAFVVLVPFTFSDQLLAAAYDAANVVQPGWVLPATDAMLLALLLALTLWLWCRVIQLPSWRIRAWWAVAAVATLGLDTADHYLISRGSMLVDLGAALLYIFLLAILLAAIVGASPILVLTPDGRRRDPVGWQRFRSCLPLLVGTTAAYVSSITWDLQLSQHAIRTMDDARDYAADKPNLIDGLSSSQLNVTLNGLCRGAIDPQYFAQISQVLPLLLIALAFEAKFFEWLRSDPVSRAMGTVTVVILALAELLTISVLPKSNKGCEDVLYAWHEYAAFLVTSEAAAVALTSIIWAAALLPRAGTTGSGQVPAGDRN
jgi:hypothetical protein